MNHNQNKNLVQQGRSTTLRSPLVFHPHRTPLPFFDSLLSLPLFSLSSYICIHFHISPSQRLPFIETRYWLSFSLHCFKTRVQPQNASPFQFTLSILLSTSVFLLRHTHTLSHTHRHAHILMHTHTHLPSKIISWLQFWPQTSGRFLMEPGYFIVSVTPIFTF